MKQLENCDLPSFLCIGAQKAGTSWLDKNLRDHPEIWMPPIKELHFFDHLFIPRFRRWTSLHIHRMVLEALSKELSSDTHLDSQYLRALTEIGYKELFTERWYERIFSLPGTKGKVTGEITPEYSTIPSEGISYLKSYLDDPKIIYIIRDPVSRAISQIGMNIRNRHGFESQRAVEEMSVEQWKWHLENWDVNQRGKYSKYVPNWNSKFSESEIMFIPYQEISLNPEALLSRIENFLCVVQNESYPWARIKVFAGKRLRLPEFVVEELQENMKPEIEFLAAEFGKDFIEMI